MSADPTSAAIDRAYRVHRATVLATLIRFVNDILLSAPSILIGLFVYTLMVQPMGGYSGWAGGVASSIS